MPDNTPPIDPAIAEFKHVLLADWRERGIDRMIGDWAGAAKETGIPARAFVETLLELLAGHFAAMIEVTDHSCHEIVAAEAALETFAALVRARFAQPPEEP